MTSEISKKTKIYITGNQLYAISIKDFSIRKIQFTPFHRGNNIKYILPVMSFTLRLMKQLTRSKIGEEKVFQQKSSYQNISVQGEKWKNHYRILIVFKIKFAYLTIKPEKLSLKIIF